MDKPKWKKYEDLVYEIQKEISPEAEIIPNDRIYGQDSKTDRQIDISIKRSIGQFTLLIIIDCKDYKVPVDVKDVGEFVSLVKDVRANKGALVSSIGFTEAALEMAKTHGIDTLRHVDTKSIDWKTYITIPVLLERTFLKGYQFTFTKFEALPIEVTNIKPIYLEAYDTNNKRMGLIGDILAKRWNNEEISHVPGEIKIIIGEGIIINTPRGRYKTNITANLIVGREYYFGGLPIETRGFYNEQTKAYTTREIITDKLEPYLIETGQAKDWQKIDDLSKLAIQPVITTAYSDCMTLMEKESEDEQEK